MHTRLKVALIQVHLLMSLMIHLVSIIVLFLSQNLTLQRVVDAGVIHGVPKARLTGVNPADQAVVIAVNEVGAPDAAGEERVADDHGRPGGR